MNVRSVAARLPRKKVLMCWAVLAPLVLSASTSQAALLHRYDFATDASDSVGTAHGTLRNIATVSGGQLQFNNPNFSGSAFAGGYLALPPSILPSSVSATILQWGTYNGSGFFTEAYTFTDHNNDLGSPEVISNPPGAAVGQYLMHTVSNPAGGPGAPAQGGSSIAQATAGYSVGSESRAFETTPALGAGGGGYLDDGGTYFSATVIDGTAGTLSYYVYRASDGAGGLQQTIASVPLSSYSFTNAYLGRSPFPGDNWLSGSVDEFRIYTDARSTEQILRDFRAGPNALVPEPSSILLFGVAVSALAGARRRWTM